MAKMAVVYSHDDQFVNLMFLSFVSIGAKESHVLREYDAP